MLTCFCNPRWLSTILLFSLLLTSTLEAQPEDFVWPEPGVAIDIKPQVHEEATLTVKEAVKAVLDKPNDAKAHWELAKALYKRGAGNDLIRFWRHASRACELNSSLLRTVEGFTSREEVKFRRLLRPTKELLEADETINNPLPPKAIRHSKTSRLLIIRLGKRLSSASKQRGFSIATCRKLVEQVFDWHGSTGGSKWQRRFRELEENCFENASAQRVGKVLTKDILPKVRERLLKNKDFGRTRVEINSGKELSTYVLDAKMKLLASLFERDMSGCATQLIDLVATFDSAASLSTGISPYERVVATSGRNQGQMFVLRAGIPAAFRDTYRGGLETLEAMVNPEVPADFAVGQIVDFVVSTAPVVVGSPLLIDLDGDNMAGVLTGVAPDGVFEKDKSVAFDLNGDGKKEMVEWLTPKADGLLCVDLDGDGLINSGIELFGTAHGDMDGFERLQVFDIDQNGWIEGAEAANLSIWVDDGDGLCQEGEVQSLAKANIIAISCQPSGNCSEVKLVTGSAKCWDWWPDCR